MNGAWAARCLTAAGYGPGVCHDARPETAAALAAELGWRTGSREEAAPQDVVVTCTPGDEPVIFAADLRAGQHLAVLGADRHGKAEVEREALGAAACSATSGSRQAPAASSPARSRRAASAAST